MGASESTGRSNGIENEEDEQRRQESSGVSTKAATAIAVAAAGAAVAAWSISRMLSDNAKEQSSGYRGIGHDDGDCTYEGAKAKQSSMWHPPSPGRFKMNTDGISRPNPGPSAYAGILRNDRGEWVRGFVGFLGDAEILTAEIYGIYQGLRLLIKLKKKGSILESDSHEAVCWTTRENKSYENPSAKMPHCSTIITECWRLARENNISIKQINGYNANQCADGLAELALRLEQKYLEIKKIPYQIKNLVDKERV